jgi:dienelactone hydrolase
MISGLSAHTLRAFCCARRLLIACLLGLLPACENIALETDAAPVTPPREAGAPDSQDRDARSELARDAQPGGAGAGDASSGAAGLDAGARSDAAGASTSADDAAPADVAAPALDGMAAGAVPVSERTRDFAVATRRIDIPGDGGRTLPVQLWYPAVDQAAGEADAGHALEEFEAAGPRRELLKNLIKEAHKDCPNLTMHAAWEAPPYARSAPFPLLVYSHHFNGSRFSMFSIAEGLARAGMVVAAPDHVNGSLFEREDVLSDSLRQFNDEYLQLRAADLKRVLDVLLDANSEVVPVALRGRFDATRVGAVGHSLGGFTVGVFSVNDTRVRATAYLAILPSPSLATLVFSLPPVERLRTPALFLTAHEDTVVEAMGGAEETSRIVNGQAPPAYWIDVRDSGHFSFADDSGLVSEFEEGCGMSTRLADDTSFTYLAPERAREIASHYTTAFFATELLGEAATRLAQPQPAELVTIKVHEAKVSSSADAGAR